MRFTWRAGLPALMLLMLAGGVQADTSAAALRDQAKSARSDSDSLRKEIKTAQHQLNLSQAERNKQQQALREAEHQIDSLQKSLAGTQRETHERQARVVELKQRQAQLSVDRGAQLGQLRQDVQSAYRAGHADYFKLLLNQESPALLARELRYYGYLQQARSTRINQLDGTLTELAALQQEETEQLKQLAILQARLADEQQQLAAAQAKREAALKVLNSQIQTQSQNLQALKQNQAALQALMRRLERAAREQDRLEQERRRQERERLAREAQAAQAARDREAREAGKAASAKPQPAPPSPPPARDREQPAWSQEPDYSSGRGNCPLPASGGVRYGFGTERGGGLRWNGVVIAAPMGAPVKVVKSGKVLYADFLRGYGKLVIVDHGGGFMSLYGYNQSLQVKVNESVSAGQTIATVGAADGDAESGLYFEIRLRGRPSQPGGWCNF